MNYRANVAAILRNPEGKLLVCERVKEVGQWQFPQGSVDTNETLEEALVRELGEEISVEPHQYRIVLSKGPYFYNFSHGQTKKGFAGKEQLYFLCDFSDINESVRVETAKPEFRAYRWIRPQEFQLAWLPAFKHEVYRNVFWDFFGVRI